SSIGSSGMNAFMALDLILGSAGGHAVLIQNYPVTTAWFPANKASSPKDAMDKFHAIRTEALKKSLRERGVKYEVTRNDLDYKYTPWNKPFHVTILTITEEFDGLCSTKRPCVLGLRTALPEPKTVIAPKELIGQPYEAYLFSARTAKSDIKTDRFSVFTSGLYSADENVPHSQSRDFENFTWLNKHLPEWTIAYMHALHPSVLAEIEKGEDTRVNPFPYMVHNGEVKLFAVEKKNE